MLLSDPQSVRRDCGILKVSFSSSGILANILIEFKKWLLGDCWNWKNCNHSNIGSALKIE